MTIKTEIGPALDQMQSNLARAIVMLAVLSNKFDVPPVQVAYTKGRAYYHNDCIFLNEEDEEYVVLHEFAHYLDHRKGNRASRDADRRSRGSRRDPHGTAFVILLAAVATKYYGEPQSYPWHKDYRSVHAKAKKFNLT